MIITSSDVLHHESVDVDTQITITSTSIHLSIRSTDKSNSDRSAISFLSGDVASSNPFVVTLDKRAVIDEAQELWGIDTINAYQMMRVAQMVSGNGRGEYHSILNIIDKDINCFDPHPLSSLGDSPFSRYIMKGICIFAINHNLVDQDFIDEYQRIKDKFISEAFVASKKSPASRSIVARVRSLSERGVTNV